MTHLVYCIMKAPAVGRAPLTGVAGQEVSLVSTHGLGAAVSAVPATASAPPVSELLAYGRVVEELCQRQAVVPMRYGCVLEGVAGVRRLLAERQLQYEALLKELEGQVEMGLRILLPAPGVTQRQGPPPADGRGYLARRQAHYRWRDEDSRQHQDLLERYIQAFAGLSGKRRTETAGRDGAVVLSLYCLIPAGQIGRFRECFQRLAAGPGPKALLSGPWPPYNFVTATG